MVSKQMKTFLDAMREKDAKKKQEIPESLEAIREVAKFFRQHI